MLPERRGGFRRRSRAPLRRRPTLPPPNALPRRPSKGPSSITPSPPTPGPRRGRTRGAAWPVRAPPGSPARSGLPRSCRCSRYPQSPNRDRPQPSRGRCAPGAAVPSSAAAPRACSAQGDSPGPGGDKETPEEVTGLPPGLPVSSFSELILFTLLPVLSLSCRPAWGWPAPTSPSVPGPPGPSSLPTAWNPGSGDPERTAKESPQAPAQNHLADGSPVSYPAPLPWSPHGPPELAPSPIAPHLALSLTGWSVFRGAQPWARQELSSLK